jgi:S1-C subfamily serine protease
VKFRGERAWRRARVVRVARGEDDDLALLRLEDAGTVPAVQGLAADDAALREGAPIVSIGYPLGRETPMEGSDGDAFVARTSLYPGTISKALPNVVQVAAWAGHGSSGSPILEPGGLVVGVVWGGPPEGGGRLVYAVPASRVAAFLRDE